MGAITAIIEAIERFVKTLRASPRETAYVLLIGLAVYQEMGKQALQKRKEYREAILQSKIDTLASKVIATQEDKIRLQDEVLRLTDQERRAAQQRIDDLLRR